MEDKPHILITNDDGIHAMGIHHLYNALKDKYRVTIVAPHVEQSGVGLSISCRTPLRLMPATNFDEGVAWSVNGTPADCVKLALHALFDQPPALIASGINRGTNAGRNVLYSGTIGGVIEGTLRGISGIAFSSKAFHNPEYLIFEQHACKIVEEVLANPLPFGTLLNVNFPGTNTPKGFRLAKQGRQYWIENPDQRHHPTEGQTYYWLGAKLNSYDEDPESDVALLREGYTVAVPLQVSNLTDQQALEERKQRFEQL